MFDAYKPLRPLEAAGYLNISLTTLYDWIAKGILKPGRHFIRFGHVTLFVCGPRLFSLLLKDTLTTVKREETPALKPVIQKIPMAKKPRASINRDYFDKIVSAREERR